MKKKKRRKASKRTFKSKFTESYKRAKMMAALMLLVEAMGPGITRKSTLSFADQLKHQKSFPRKAGIQKKIRKIKA